MAGKDLRLTAIFAVRDQLSPVIQKLASRWKGLRNTLNSDNFKKLNGQFRQFRRSLTNVTDQVTEAGKNWLCRLLQRQPRLDSPSRQ